MLVDSEWLLVKKKSENKIVFEKIQRRCVTFLKSNQKFKKKFKFFEYVNYTPQDLVQHFEECFEFYKPLFEMNWENYGTVWDLEHFIPRCSDEFAFGSMDDRIKKCFDIKNLRPFGVSLNIRKGSFQILSYSTVHEPKYSSYLKSGLYKECDVYPKDIYNLRVSNREVSDLELAFYEKQYHRRFWLNSPLKKQIKLIEEVEQIKRMSMERKAIMEWWRSQHWNQHPIPPEPNFENTLIYKHANRCADDCLNKKLAFYKDQAIFYKQKLAKKEEEVETLKKEALRRAKAVEVHEVLTSSNNNIEKPNANKRKRNRRKKAGESKIAQRQKEWLADYQKNKSKKKKNKKIS